MPWNTQPVGGALSKIFSRGGVSDATVLDGLYAIGSTELVLTGNGSSVEELQVGDRVRIGKEFYTLTGVNEEAKSVDIFPGLLAENDGGIFTTAPLWGETGVLQLDGGSYKQVDVRCLYHLRRPNEDNGFYAGRSIGSYFAPGSSWFETENIYGRWLSDGNVLEGQETYSVGFGHGDRTPRNMFSIEYNPSLNQLSWMPLDPATDRDQVTQLIIAVQGSGYTSAPVLTIVGGGGGGATGTVAISGGMLSGVVLTSGGSGYTHNPTITLTGGGGSGGAVVGVIGAPWIPQITKMVVSAA